MLSGAEFQALYERLRRMNPWGPDDRRGALNHLTPEAVLAAVGRVSTGRTVSMSATIGTRAAADDPGHALHTMTGTGDVEGDPDALHFATDHIEMNVHGNAHSHLDALCHVIYQRHLYNGVPASTVTSAGAGDLDLTEDRDGIVGRGVLLDIPRLRGEPWLEPGDHVYVDDLLAAERAQQITVGRGDLLFVRLGHRRRREQHGSWDVAASRAGLPLLAERQIALMGSDSNSDAAPSCTPGVDFPIHVLAINALGIQLLDYLQFEELARACEQRGDWSFLCVIAPLRFRAATGSPVNPIAIL
jgi:kynurenine formamidase